MFLCVLVAQSCPTLCNPMDCSPPGSSVHRIFQSRILEWVAIAFSRRYSQPRDWTQAPRGRQILYHLNQQGSPAPFILNIYLDVSIAQLCPILCYPTDWSLPGSSVHGIFQARILEWRAILFTSFESTVSQFLKISIWQMSLLLYFKLI